MTFRASPSQRNVTAIRQPDILVPIYTAPYALPSPVISPSTDLTISSFEASLDLVRPQTTGFGNLTFADFVWLGPTSFGRATINPQTSGVGNSNGQSHIQLGSTIVYMHDTFGNGVYYSLYPIFLGISETIKSSGVKKLFVSAEISLSGFIGENFSNNAFVFSAYFDPLHPEFGTVPYFGNSYGGFGDGDWIGANLITRPFQLPKLAATKVFPGFTGNGMSGANYTTNIPDFVANENYMIRNGNRINIFHYNIDTQFGENLILNFDNPTIDAAVAQQQVTTTFNAAIAKGFFLWEGSFAAPFGTGVVLLSKDATKWAFMRLIGQDAQATGFLTTLPNARITIDELGILYANKGVGDTAIYSSFSLSVPWPGITFPSLNLGPVNLPNESCGCMPAPIGVNKL